MDDEGAEVDVDVEAEPDYTPPPFPHDLTAESAILGSMMLDPLAANTALDLLKPQSFYDPRNAALFRILSSLYPSHPDLDPVIVRDHIKQTRQENVIGGLDRIAEFLSLTPSPANVESYCAVVNGKHARRKLLSAAYTVAKAARMATDDDMRAMAIDAIEMAVYDQLPESPQELQEAANPIIDDALTQHPRHCWGIPTRLADGAFDDLTGGVQRGQFWVLGAVPSMGKSTLVNAIAIGVSRANEGCPLILSTEMSNAAVARRAIAAEANMHTLALRRRNLTQTQRDSLSALRDKNSMKNVYCMYVGGRSVGEVRIIARSHARRFGLPLLIIDMASGLSSSSEHGEQQRMARIIAELDTLKNELDTCLLVCAHMNRATHSETGHKPHMRNLRDTGEWEQKADRVLFLHRPGYYLAGESNVTEIIQDKDREDGQRKSVFVEWLKATGQYVRAEDPCKPVDGPPRVD